MNAEISAEKPIINCTNGTHISGKIYSDKIYINIDCKHGICQTWTKHTYQIFHRVRAHTHRDTRDTIHKTHSFIFKFVSKSFSDWRNLITYCYIHNDSTVELSKCGTMIASFEVTSSKKIISKLCPQQTFFV